jgi:DNA-binding transcriptional ArsR family regulator
VTTYRADGLAALGDPTRRQIFERLAERPQAVGELASELPISRPAVSQHLKVLKDAQLVIDTRAGNRRIYELDPSGIVLLRTYLDRLWGRALASYKSEVEKRAREAS